MGRKRIVPHIKVSELPIYRVWTDMRQRCYNPNDVHYKYYGARGITICDEWKKNFKAFYDWAFSNGYIRGLTIERNDNDKGYSPENCSWITMRDQQLNKRNYPNRNSILTTERVIHIRQKLLSVKEYSELYGIHKSTVSNLQRDHFKRWKEAIP